MLLKDLALAAKLDRPLYKNHIHLNIPEKEISMIVHIKGPYPMRPKNALPGEHQIIAEKKIRVISGEIVSPDAKAALVQALPAFFSEICLNNSIFYDRFRPR